MGLMNCEKHGYRGIAWNMTNDIALRILNDQAMSSDEIVIVTHTLYDGKEFLGDVEHMVSIATKERLKLKDAYISTTDEESEQFEKLLRGELGGVCVDCFNEYKEKHGWKPLSKNTDFY